MNKATLDRAWRNVDLCVEAIKKDHLPSVRSLNMVDRLDLWPEGKKLLWTLGAAVVIIIVGIWLFACDHDHRKTIIEACPPGHIENGKCCAVLEDGTREWVPEGLGEGHEVESDGDACDDRGE